MKITNNDISDDANIEDIKLNTIHTKGKVSNSATTASVSNHSNTIVLRDNDGATKLASIFFTGANYLHKNIASSLLKNIFLYFTNKERHHYAVFRNLNDCGDAMNLSLDIGQNNSHGNFNIRTINNGLKTNNFCIKNNFIGINNKNPQHTLDVSGNVYISNNLNAYGTITTSLNKGIVGVTSAGVLINKLIETTDLSDNIITSSKLDTNLNLQGFPTCNTNSLNPNSIVNVNFLMDLISSFPNSSTITHIYDNTQFIYFNFSTYVLECSIDVHLPTYKGDGYNVTFINKSGSDILFISTEQLFNILYSPNGDLEIVVPNNCQIRLTYVRTLTSNSWCFTLN